jgi:hypothetical protein
MKSYIYLLTLLLVGFVVYFFLRDMIFDTSNDKHVVASENFEVPAQSEKIISFDASFSSIGALSIIKDIITKGLKLDVTVTGFIDTDLGRIDVNYKKKIGSKGVNGISAPLNVKDNYFLFWKKNRQPVGTSLNEVHDYILTCLNTGSKLYDFTIETDKGEKYNAPEFLKLLKSKGFLLSTYSLN